MIGARNRALFGLLAAMLLAGATHAQAAGAAGVFGVHGLTIGGTGIWTGVIMLGGWMLKEWRETRKLSSEDRLARREGYAKQVESLQVENRNLRSDLVDVEHRYDDHRRACREETDQLRGQIRELEDMVTGFKRQLAAQASALGRAMLGSTDTGRVMERDGE